MKNILLVEDDEVLGKNLKAVLENNGYCVEWAVNGKNALEKINTQSNFDLIILDLMMPEMSGYAFYDELKQRINKMPQVLVLTNLNPVAYQSEIKHVLIKAHVSLTEILDKVSALVGGNNANGK